MSAPPPKARGWTLFCDDIRFEIDGKITVVGSYPASAIVINGDFPASIGKIGLLIRYTEDIGAFTSDPQLEVYFPGISEPVVKVELKMEASRKSAAEKKVPDGADLEVSAGGVFPIVVSPALFQEAGWIKVRLKVDGHSIKLGACEVVRSPIAIPSQTFTQG
jgi:hypothetical protein